MLQIFILAQLFYTNRNEIQSVRFGLELACNVKSRSHRYKISYRHEFHFDYVELTP